MCCPEADISRRKVFTHLAVDEDVDVLDNHRVLEKHIQNVTSKFTSFFPPLSRFCRLTPFFYKNHITQT